MMALGGEEGVRFVYIGCNLSICWNINILDVLNESGINDVQCSRRVVGAIRSLVNASGLQLECVRVLHETLLMPVFMYGSETTI